MSVIIWLFRHPVGASLLFMLLLSAGSSALAKYEIGINRGLRVQIDMANASLERQQHNQQIVTEVSSAYENRLANLNHRLAVARMRPAICVPVSAPSGIVNGSSGTASGPAGLTSEYLLEYEGQCHKEVYKLIGLQEFINGISR